MIRIPRSRIFSDRIKSEEDFHAAVAACRAALEAHCLGPAGRPVPMYDEAVEAVITRVPQEGPVATRGPDQFVVQDYEIFDDAPPQPPLPPPLTLEQRKQLCLMDLHVAAQAARDAVLSPARAQLLNFDVSDAMAVPEQQRSLAQLKAIEAFTAFSSRCADIARNVALAQVEIEDLTDVSIGLWRIPQL
jgi:hypothetical protein